MDRPGPKQKSFDISKRLVWDGWRKVKANKGAGGVDGQSLELFEKDLKNQLFKVWNRMSSGSYFPPPVRVVAIPKSDGGVRVLGVPTVADRVAQTAVARFLEPAAEKLFVADSYGYRPGVSAHEAVGACQQRCWKYDWVIDLDIRAFFDTVPWDLVLKAVGALTTERWVLLLVERWLAAPLAHPDGTLQERTKGTPQGSAISPILANLFMHFAFDAWMARTFPDCPCERYADDAVVHCTTRAQAERVLAGIAARMNEVGLELHPQKTRIVYCKDDRRRGRQHPHTAFTFLGFEFRARRAWNKRQGKPFSRFMPAMSPAARKAAGQMLRELRIDRRTDLTLDQLAELVNPITRGWINYYGRFYRSALNALLRRVSFYLKRWAQKKYRRLRSEKRFKAWWTGLQQRQPALFAHWSIDRAWAI